MRDNYSFKTTGLKSYPLLMHTDKLTDTDNHPNASDTFDSDVVGRIMQVTCHNLLFIFVVAMTTYLNTICNDKSLQVET